MYIPSHAYRFPVYQPAMRVIADITNSNPVIITTTFNHQYVNGLIVRLDIPPRIGMQQLNQMFGPITVTSNTTFTVPIDTIYFDPFILPANFPPGYQDAQSVPIGEISSMLSAATQNVLPYSAT